MRQVKKRTFRRIGNQDLVPQWLDAPLDRSLLADLGPPLRRRYSYLDGRPRSPLVDSLHFQQQAHIGWVRARRFELAKGGGGT